MRRTTLYVAAVLGLLLACALATVLAAVHERDAAAVARDRHADRAVGRLQAELTSAEEALRGLEGLFAASEEVGPAEFAAYTRHLFGPRGIERLAYAELVPGRERRAWERRTGLAIRTLGPAGLRPAPRRGAYLPMRFVRGRESRVLLGWDMSSEPVRAAALAAARSARAARLTAPVRLIAPDRLGVLMVLPVYHGTRGPTAEAQGFVVGGYRVDELSRGATAHLPEGTTMRIADGGDVLAGPAGPLDDATRRRVDVAGRTWTVDVTGGPGMSWTSPLGVAAAGLLVTGLLALMFRQAARRERYALELVAARLRERDAAESRLRASEEAFRMLAEGSTDMISLHWPDGRYVYVSPSSVELTGYTPEELAGRSPREFLHPDDLARLERETAGLDDAGVVTTTFRFRHKAGHHTWLEATERLVLDDRGEVVEVRAAARCVDQRVRAETALREREERIRSLVQSASDGIVMADTRGNIISWNEGATRIFGYTAEVAIGRSLGIIMPERYREGHARAFAAVAGGREPRLMNQVIELEGLRSDGTEFPLELTLGSWHTEEGRFFAGVIRDVTSRKAEEAERQSQERFRTALLASLSEGVAACDADGRLVFFNDARRRLHAFADEPTTIAEWARLETLFRPDGLTPLTAEEFPLSRVLAGETVRDVGVVLIAGGVRRRLQVTGEAIRDDDGRVIGAVTAAHDVTERVETAARLERTSRQLESILDAVGEGVYGLDAEGRVTFANPAAAAMLGWEVEELLGQSQDGLVHPTGHDGRDPRERSQIWMVLEDGEARRAEDEIFWRRDGHAFPVSYVTSPLRAGEEVVGAVVTFQDISERRAVERMKDEFISMVSHELRTPLTSIRGALSILADDGELPPAAERRMLEIACANTERLVRLINDILDLERIGSGEEALERGSWDAHALAEDAVALIAPLADEHGVTIDADVPRGAMEVDPDRIIQVLTNLLGNAIKFSPAGGRVSVRGRVEAEEVVITVADEGRGIPREKLETIFERFQQVDASDSRQAGGTGLGLAICRRIAQLHGGRVWAESEPGRGSAFHLALPRSEAPAQTRETPFLAGAV